MREKERLQDLRNKLQGGIQRLTLLTNLAARCDNPRSIYAPLLTPLTYIRKSSRVDNATMLARIEEIHQLNSQAQSDRKDILDILQKQRTESKEQAEKQCHNADEAHKLLSMMNKTNCTVLDVTRDAQCSIVQVENLLTKVSQNVTNLQLEASNSMFIRPLDPTKGLPVILEDALGRSLDIPAQWIETLEWQVCIFHLSTLLKPLRIIF